MSSTRRAEESRPVWRKTAKMDYYCPNDLIGKKTSDKKSRSPN